ncbi:hypothetical protein F0562_020710 [Nyssa sinensis]|uniref:Leucine-rich repeat-containing N-terminal plant-type domain-containing protein n=1 Tax=Nyssa sinensis TaxID=561372 RepID=A0A5J5BSA6_9ASTE|nr:hypothetical protein F0562_020710 [Nyssa sinensis]
MVNISFYVQHLILTLTITLPYFLCVICTHQCGCEESPPPQPPPLVFLSQRLAVVYPVIQSFKNTITSDPLGITQTWVGSDICNYTGFYCDILPDNTDNITALAGIDFNGYQLAAPTLDGFIDQLPDLAIFHANTNNFSGTISPNISKLPYFYELDISNNKFSGQFPMSVLGIKDLTFLDIRYNSFTGSVPPQVFMQRLDVLFINNNNFMQRLPDNLGSTPALYLTFANNKFTGPIPRSIGKAAATLTEVLFLNNQFTGCIPYELGFLGNATVIDVGNNLLTGPLPCSLGCLESAEQLNFAGNFLYGQVPEAVCALRNLVNLSLSFNYFTGVGPLCWKLIKSGVLDVKKNCIHGLPGQRSWAECMAFFWHPKYCPYFASYSIIPCKLHPYLHSPPPPSSRSGRHLLSYSALLRRRL